MNYTIIRSERKTIAIYITADAAVEVRAPRRAAKADIDRFVDSKRGWIDRRLAEQRRRAENRAAFGLDYGGSVVLQGKDYPVTARDGNRAGFDGESFFLPPGLPPEAIKPVVVGVYKLIAKRLLTEKTGHYAKIMGVKPSAVKINSAVTRWGSCSNKRSLNFSWRLVMADDDVIDYVAVHELAHIRQLNHSAAFWAEVASVIPDYAERRARLKILQKRLANEDWN